MRLGHVSGPVLVSQPGRRSNDPCPVTATCLDTAMRHLVLQTEHAPPTAGVSVLLLHFAQRVRAPLSALSQLLRDRLFARSARSLRSARVVAVPKRISSARKGYCVSVRVPPHGRAAHSSQLAQSCCAFLRSSPCSDCVDCSGRRWTSPVKAVRKSATMV